VPSLTLFGPPTGLKMGYTRRVPLVCTIAVATAMTRDVAYCRPDDLLHDIWTIMKERSLLHIPVVDQDLKPRGVLNARDALFALLEGVEHDDSLLRDYVMGIGYR
jgi:CBS domain-containing protein